MKRHLFLLWTLLLTAKASAKKPRPTSSGVVDARLVNGHSPCSGHLEMKHQGQWRTLTVVSSLSVAMGDFSEIACRQMGCGSVISFKLHSNTTVSTPAWEMPFSCLVSDLTLQECIKKARPNIVEDVQSAVTSTYVECSDSVRVTDKTPFSYCSGKVTVKSGQNWIHVCETETPKSEKQIAKKVCAELGCGSPKSTKHISTQTGVESRIIQCHGNETQLQQCPASAHSNCTKVLHIECLELHFPPYRFHMRLVGESRCRGVLEGKSRLEWRPLTTGSYRFEEHELMYLCAILDCGNSISSTNLHLGQNVSLWEIKPECDGGFCSTWFDKHGQSGLNIACTESVRMLFSEDRCSGNVEIKHKDDWYHLCHEGLSLRDAFVACRDLDCGFPQEFRNGMKIGNALSLNCSGHEEHLTDCPVSSLPAEGAAEECEATVLVCKKPPAPKVTMFSRLADVHQKALIAYDGHEVLTTCNNDSPLQVKSFVLKFSSKNVTEVKGNQSAVDNAAQFVFEAELNQNGSYHCSYDYESSPDVFSDHTEFHLSVKESLYARLSGRESRCLGRLELEHEGEWRAVSQEQWGLKEAAVVCRQLHCGSVISTDTQRGEMQPVWRFYSDCDGSERALLDCGSVRRWMSSTTVHVLCSDIVAPPNITVLADRLYPENTEQVVVHEGHSFFVNCSVESQFPDGRFSLVFRGSLREAVINHWAIFKFNKIRKDQSGNYTCVYHNLVSQHHFTFESKTVTITVQESADIKLDDGQQRDDGSKSCSGTLFMKNGASKMKMVTVKTSAWDIRHASIVCRQLGCGDAVSTSKLQLQTFKSMWRFFSDCDGWEDALLDCGHIDEWFSSAAVQVVCAGNN